MRIFPEMCASTSWPLSSSTRNMALGRGSVTLPSSTIASSLGFGRVVLLGGGTGGTDGCSGAARRARPAPGRPTTVATWACNDKGHRRPRRRTVPAVVRSRPRFAASLVLVVGLALAACGGGDGAED